MTAGQLLRTVGNWRPTLLLRPLQEPCLALRTCPLSQYLAVLFLLIRASSQGRKPERQRQLSSFLHHSLIPLVSLPAEREHLECLSLPRGWVGCIPHSWPPRSPVWGGWSARQRKPDSPASSSTPGGVPFTPTHQGHSRVIASSPGL